MSEPQWEACKVCGGDHWTTHHGHDPRAHATAPTPREVLAGLPPATCYRTHTQPDEHLGVAGAVWLADVERALTRREPQTLSLDVERLALALDEWRPMLKAWLKPKGVQPSTRQTAETIAAECARLARQEDADVS